MNTHHSCTPPNARSFPGALAPLVAAVLLQTPALAQTDAFAAWTHRAPVQVTTPGLTSLDLPPEVMDASRVSSLGDLRLVDPSGNEAAFVLEWPALPQFRTEAVADFKSTLQGDQTVLEFSTPANGAVDEVTLHTGTQAFIKAATVEGTSNGTEWRTLVQGGVIFRQGGVTQLTLKLPAAVWQRLRITLDDRRHAPVAFTGASVRLSEPETLTVTQPLVHFGTKSERSRGGVPGFSIVKLDARTTGLYVRSLRIKTSEAVFQRDVAVTLCDAEGKPSVEVGRGPIYRVALDDQHAEELEIPVFRQMPGRVIELRIENGDSPPLRIDSVEAERYRLSMVFHAATPGEWHLLAGNAAAVVPRYDLAALSGQLRSASAGTATSGNVEPNPDFLRQAALPQPGEGGAPLDVSKWGWRKPVNVTGTGVVQLALDAQTLSGSSHHDFRDLRLIQAGRQIPYLASWMASMQEVPVTSTIETDEKRPSFTRWRIELPFAGHVAEELRVRSPLPYFKRSVWVREEARDDFGNPERRTLGNTFWSRQTEKPEEDLVVRVQLQPKTATILLETDDADNAPLRLDSMRIAFRQARLIFPLQTTEPVYLYYGKNRVSEPRYDLELVRRDFETAPKIPATLGEEEKLKGGGEPYGASSGVGSAWLWAALALVVAGLLWVVARMLPKEVAK